MWWGVVGPVYFKAVAAIPAVEVLAHRVVWTMILLWGLIYVLRRGRTIAVLLADRATVFALVGSAIMIAINWYAFIWAVQNSALRDASLGYYINPLVNILLGRLFLGERLRGLQLASVAIALLAVSFRVASVGGVPVVSLTLAVSFGFYGLIRKRAKVDAILGLATETTLVFPLAMLYLLLSYEPQGSAASGVDWSRLGLLSLGGAVTAVPLLAFAESVRRLRLATIGFMQYLAPSLQLMIAVLAFGEPFDRAQGITFGLIWIALSLYSYDAISTARRSVPGVA